MRKKLKKYYDEKGISPVNFRCVHLKSCMAKARNRTEFTTGHGTYLGNHYENGKFPRLLFLSLDSGSAEQDPDKRTFEAIKNFNIKWLPDFSNGDKEKHWYRTHQFAMHIFHELNNIMSLKLKIGNVDRNFDFVPLTEIHKIKPYFAHVNSAKCCMNNEFRKQANPTLFKNCRDYILGELEILKPDILVTQGDPAMAVAERIKISKRIKSENISNAGRMDDLHEIMLESGKIILWIHHYHPNTKRYVKSGTDVKLFPANFKHYAKYAKKAASFIKQYYSKN